MPLTDSNGGFDEGIPHPVEPHGCDGEPTRKTADSGSTADARRVPGSGREPVRRGSYVRWVVTPKGKRELAKIRAEK